MLDSIFKPRYTFSIFTTLYMIILGNKTIMTLLSRDQQILV